MRVFSAAVVRSGSDNVSLDVKPLLFVSIAKKERKIIVEFGSKKKDGCSLSFFFLFFFFGCLLLCMFFLSGEGYIFRE